MKYAFILCLVLTLAAGCVAAPQNFPPDSPTTSNDPVAPTSAATEKIPTIVPTQIPEPTKTTKPAEAPTLTPQPTAVVNDNLISKTGWQKYSSDVDYAFSTDDWFSYSFENVSSSFSIEYPADWTLEGSVFYDADEKKIAEFSPGLVILKTGQECFDVFVGESDYGEIELISDKQFTIGQYAGALRIVKVMYEGGSPNWSGIWYPNQYCLSDGTMAFVMSFYEYELNSDNQDLFKEIISTLKFE